VLLVRTTDYTATNGTSVVLATAATLSDTLVVVAYGAFNVANTYTQAEADARYPLNTSSFFAGKNKIINGDFFVNQRSFTSTTAGGYTFDRWRHGSAGGTVTTTAQTFTLGTAPVAGYEGKNFIQQATTGHSAAGDYSFIGQGIEGVRNFAGQIVTVSFWAKASAGTPKVGITLRQVFGTGGSTTVSTADAGQAISTSWARYTSTITLPSIAGKTIAGGDDLLDLLINTSTGSTLAALGWSNIGIQNSTIAVWGIQVEAGTVATAFQTATGSIGGELALCQRYYYRTTGNTSAGGHPVIAATQSAASAYCYMPLPVTMRTNPSSIDYSGVRLVNYGVAAYAITSLNLSLSETSPSCAVFTADGASGMTANRPVFLYASASTNYIGFSAEL
jgi:hypothetical protein